MLDCIFCKIANKQIDSDIVFEDEDFVVFKDINPVADIHLLIIPRIHVESLMEIDRLDASKIKNMFIIINKMADEFGISSKGFRVVTNIGESACQSVRHLHFHIIGGRKFVWPPG
ncbi:MAG TPA: histidine triad nucleotide-binding protein [Actinobacteria bacterium]|nr:histidine triad nucleotide-binding protein [Actinomycetota bacterium]